MNIGIVTTWFERGAAYVSKIYMNLLENEGHSVYIFARGGDASLASISKEWSGNNVTRSNKYIDTTIEKKKFYGWIKKNNIEALLFNEQQDFRILIDVKRKFPNLKLGAYVDYYTEYTLRWFDLYDFLICNTKRHMQAMSGHPQKYYVRWGTDVNVFKPIPEEHKEIVFFHSVGQSYRKGTDVLINAFIDGEVYRRSKLLVHTQIPIEKNCTFTKDELSKYNVEVVEKTVTAPGLYHKGDVYVYPTRLDGLGLTMYEALASGLPMIVTDFPPMNEVGNKEIVKYVKVADHYCRGDGYYYPMSICDKSSLIDSMNWFIDHKGELGKLKKKARQYAVDNYDISKKGVEISEIFMKAETRPLDEKLAKEVERAYLKNTNIFKSLLKCRKIYEIRNRA